jgi:hypothetical protein
MRMKPTNAEALARRDVLKVVLGAAAVGLTRFDLAAAHDIGSDIRGVELFAFRAPTSSTLVFAVAFPATLSLRPSKTPMPVVRIHAGPRSWAVNVERAAPRVDLGGALVRSFVGRVATPAAQGGAPYHLIAVSAAAAAFAPGALGVFAEIEGPGDSRTRVGNPIVAELLAGDPALARAHSTPDRAMFASALADRISARSLGRADPRSRADRIATMLASDTLSFDPGQPEGFTFAGQNGRRPFDATADVVDTVLAGVVSPRLGPGIAFHPSRSFPYFSSAVA